MKEFEDSDKHAPLSARDRRIERMIGALSILILLLILVSGISLFYAGCIGGRRRESHSRRQHSGQLELLTTYRASQEAERPRAPTWAALSALSAPSRFPKGT